MSHEPHTRRRLPDLLVESAMIVLSVLLALAANAWADGRKQHRLEVQAHVSLIREIRSNQLLVARALPYHEALTRAVIAVDTAGGVRSYAAFKQRVPMWSGLEPPDLAASAWQGALTTGAIGGRPFGEVAALSRLYTVQAKLDAFTLAYLPIFDFSDPAMGGTVRRLNVYMQTVLSFEHHLVRDYDAALTALGETGVSTVR